MNFAIVSTATAVAGIVLGLGWLFAGKQLHKRWAIEATEQSLLVGRRLGAAYLGIAILLLLGRSAGPSELRTAICVGMLIALLVLAFLGLLEYKSRRAGPGILVSVVLEFVLAAGFGWVIFE